MHSDKFIQYTTISWSGKRLVAEHPLHTRGVWKITGENPMDGAGGMGCGAGAELGIVEGILEDVINYALTLDRFWQGDIKFIATVIPIVDTGFITRREELLEEIKQAEANLESLRQRLKAYQ
jgi:hypothetical protein